MLDCRKIKQLLSLYLDDLLSTEEKEAVKKHLDSCVSCQQDYQALQRLKTWLEQMGRDIYPAPPGLKDTVISQLKERQTVLPVIAAEKKGKSRWKQISVGIAAAALLAFTAAGNQIGTLVQVAEKNPSSQQTVINNPSGDIPTALQTNEQNSNNTATDPVNKTPDTTMQGNNGSNVEGPTKPDDNTNTEQIQGNPLQSNITSLNPVLLNKNQQIENTLLKMQVDDVDKTITQINTLAEQKNTAVDNLGEQTSDKQVYRIFKFTVDKSKSDELVTSLQQLGTTVSKQADDKDLSVLYTETLEQYLTLDKQRKSLAADNDQCKQIEQQMQSLEEELKSLQKKASQATIVLWLQDK